MIGLQLGFGMVSVLDPESLIQESLMDMFFFFIFILIFLSMDGDHIFLGAMSDSFHLIPVGQLIYPVKLFQDILIKSVVMFVIAMKIAFPMLGPLMIVTTVLGIISKAVPKMEVFLISFPLKIFLGFIMIIILLPILPWFIDGILIEMDRWIYQVLEMLA
jgi:flagellar biosynthetic protein FliR